MSRDGGSVRRSTGALAAALAALAAVSATSREAGAIERQHHLGIGPTLGILQVKDKSTLSVGGGGTVHYAYGVSDQFNFAAEAGSVIVAANQNQDTATSPKNRPATVDHALVGATYVIDILRWVPYLGAQIGGYRVAGGTVPNALFIFGAAVGAGLDYQFTRQIAVGIAANQNFLLTKLSTYPSYTTATLRVEYMWGY